MNKNGCHLPKVAAAFALAVSLGGGTTRAATVSFESEIPILLASEQSLGSLSSLWVDMGRPNVELSVFILNADKSFIAVGLSQIPGGGGIGFVGTNHEGLYSVAGGSQSLTPSHWGNGASIFYQDSAASSIVAAWSIRDPNTAASYLASLPDESRFIGDGLVRWLGGNELESSLGEEWEGRWRIMNRQTICGCEESTGFGSVTTVVAVPEPSVALSGMFGMLALLCRRRDC